jgi:S-adenosylmethionine decarboxylase
MKKDALGYHVLLEFHGCSSHIIADSDRIEKILLEASRISKARIVKSFFHKFNPYGVSGVVVIKESHFTIHTWPEYKYAAIDFFSCTKEIELNSTIEYLKKALKPKSVSIVELKRGII